VLRYYKQMSYSRIARALKRQLPTVRVTIFRAKGNFAAICDAGSLCLRLLRKRYDERAKNPRKTRSGSPPIENSKVGDGPSEHAPIRAVLSLNRTPSYNVSRS